MIRSMTGFGRAESIGDMFALTVEARSVNHRNLDIAVRLPAVLASLEMEARRLIQSRLERGRIDVTVQLAPAAGQSAQAVRVNTALARRYLAEARALASELGLNEDGTLAWLLERPAVIQLEDAPSLDVAAAWPRLAQALGDALDALVARRTAEGAALDSELRGLVARVAAQTSALAGRGAPGGPAPGGAARGRGAGVLGRGPAALGRGDL